MKRYIMMILYFVIFVIVLVSDERENRRDKINVGYENEETVSLLENTVRSDRYYDDMVLLDIRTYDTEENMLRNINGDRIDILFLTDRKLLFGKDMANVKVVLEYQTVPEDTALEYQTESEDTVLICVTDKALEGELENVLKVLKIIDISKEKKFLLIQKDDWRNMYTTEEYNEEIRAHMMFDFQDELLK